MSSEYGIVKYLLKFKQKQPEVCYFQHSEKGNEH